MPTSLEAWFKILTPLGAVAVFAWGAFEFLATQRGQVETRRIEATRPFLDRQLKLYTEATKTAATLATSPSKEDVSSATERFQSLFWGELALVEDKRVEAAMVHLDTAMKQGKAGSELQGFSLELARACRDSLAESWGVRQWRNPHSAPSK